MRKLLFSIAIIFISLSLTSCIDLVEEVTINKDLSGKYEMYLETSGFGGMMSQMGGVPEVPQIQELDEKLRLLKAQPGISNIKKDLNAKQLKFNISFDFADEKSLNNALYALAEIKPNMFLKKFIKIKKNRVIRPNLSPYLERLLEEQELSEQLPSEDMLNYVNYKFIVNTPKEVRNTSGNRAMVQSNKTTVISSYSFRELLINKENIYLKIKM
ncbi:MULTISPECIES: hypothetical protein [unclassified Lentimicrobium]|uniref:hypothetical protein n=1 Tax=unclassified Lentimicrobium TaxID=2677434 RepID=UPI0015570583|nr:MULTISPECIES: hypothetical protein [unclassified Lentimicrobium]NPD44461.1 hypothetical protein [Lentimicrobium sp. S6]NPD84239.1 hypothetical protein [Lentimicrobium sp. L6]